MSGKRRPSELDPEYEDVTERQTKRQRLLEEGAKEATKRKIETVIRKEFMTEIQSKEMEISIIDQRLSEARLMMDRLRACIVANYYSSAGQTRSSQRKPTMETQSIHPAVKKHIIGKAPVGIPKGANSVSAEGNGSTTSDSKSKQSELHEKPTIKQEAPELSQEKVITSTPGPGGDAEEGGRGARFKLKKRIVVGNLSKYIPMDKREDNDPSTHKWMVYVRGSKEEPNIEPFVKKVWFFLHPSYRPNDLVEISTPPFHLTRRGWGEFPVRIQLHFRDSRNKKVDLIHHLKLDRTYTGLQTLGSETHVDVEIEREKLVEKQTEAHNPVSAKICSKQGTALLTFKGCLKKNQEMNSGKETSESNLAEDKTSCVQSSLRNGNTSCSPKTPTKLCRQEDSEMLRTSNKCQMVVSSGISEVSDSVACDSNAMIKQDPVHSAVPCELSSVTLKSPKMAVVKSPVRPLPSGEVTPSKGQVTVASTTVSPSKFIVSPTCTGTSAKSAATLEPTATLPAAQVSSGLSASGSQSMVYVRCVDNQGKIYLIPQQLLPQLTGLTNQQSPNKKNNLLGRSVQLGSASPEKSSVSAAGASASTVSMENMSAAKANPQSFPNFTSLLRPPKMNSVKQTATVSVTKANGESGLLTLNTVTSPIKTSTQVPVSNPKDIKVSTIASCPKAKQPLIFLTQNSQKAISLLQGNAASVGKTTAVIGGIGGMSLVQPPLGSPGATKPVSVGGLPVSSTGAAAKNQLPPANFVLSRSPTGVTNIVIGGTPRPQTQALTGVTSRAQGVLGAGAVPKALPSATQLVITGSSAPCQVSGSVSSVNLGGLLLKNEASNSTSEPVKPSTSSQINSGQVLKTGTTILLNKGLPMSRVPKPTASATNMALNTGATLSKLPTSQIKTSPAKTQQTMVATIGNQHYLLQLIPDQQSNKQTQSAFTNPLGGNNQAAKPLIGQTVVNLSNHLSKTSVNHALGNLHLSTSPLQTAATSACTSTTSAGTMNSVFMNPNYLTKSGNFKPVLLTSRYSRKRDKGDGDVSLLSQQRLGEMKNRIILGKKNKSEVKSEQTVNIRLEEMGDMYSLVRTVVKHYPIVSTTSDRSDHPYCARAVEDWLKWNVGKRRASEWQRASCVRQHILRLIGKNSTFRGEQVWSIKQIVRWCRLHAFSPHYLENTPGQVSPEETEREKDGKVHNSYSTSASVQRSLEDIQSSSTVPSDEDDIDVISIDRPITRIKTHIKQEEDRDLHVLPASEMAVFVQELSKKIGLRFRPWEVEPGVAGSFTEEVLFRVMKGFMEDVIRHSFASASANKKYPQEIKVQDIFRAVCSLQMADFLTNQNIGVTDPNCTSSNR